MKRLTLFIIVILSISSCREENPRTIKAWINRSDTLVQKLMTQQQPMLDSLCKVRSDAYYKSAYDSILKKRIEEINLLLDSIPINERH